jgi:hypothetical protein
MPQPTAQQLHDEIVADVGALGYKTGPGAWKEDGDIALLINQVRTGAAYRVSRPDITPAEILEAIASADYITTTISPIRLSDYESMMAQPSLRLQDDAGADNGVMAKIKSLVANGSPSASKLNNLARRLGSRAEVLWGYNVIISPYDVAMARLLGLV